MTAFYPVSIQSQWNPDLGMVVGQHTLCVADENLRTKDHRFYKVFNHKHNNVAIYSSKEEKDTIVFHLYKGVQDTLGVRSGDRVGCTLVGSKLFIFKCDFPNSGRGYLVGDLQKQEAIRFTIKRSDIHDVISKDPRRYENVKRPTNLAAEFANISVVEIDLNKHVEKKRKSK